MEPEIIIISLCTVSFFLLCWALLLRIQIYELIKKLKVLESYFSARKKLDNI